MADLCFQCNVDLFMGPYSDFNHYGRDGILTSGDDKVVYCLCEGCGGFVAIDWRGWCVDPDCAAHARPSPAASDGYGRAWGWRQRRSGRLGPLLRLRDRLLGTPWDQGWVHYVRHWWHTRKLTDDDLKWLQGPADGQDEAARTDTAAQDNHFPP